MTYAPQIKAPTLILSDTGDYRVTITQSYRLYHALRDNGVATQFIAYPVSGHRRAISRAPSPQPSTPMAVTFW